MSSNAACPTDSKVCTQAYPIRDYFLALFVIVVCLVCLRVLLYASYYTWIRISSRRQQGTNIMESRPPDQGMPLTTVQSPFGPVFSSVNDSRVCVIVPGEDWPTFIAVPAPLPPSKDLDLPVTPMKVFDVPKN